MTGRRAWVDHADPDRLRADRLCAEPHAAGERDAAFVRSAQVAATAYAAHGAQATPSVDQARADVVDGVRKKAIDTPKVYAGLSTLSRDIGARIGNYGALSRVPAAVVPNLRNDMYLVLDTTRMVTKSETAKQRFTAAEIESLNSYAGSLERGTRYIPLWGKVTVALALGLGTMVGWRRIVVTVGERIGKTHLTYGMGAAAELMTAATIFVWNISAVRCRPRTS